MNCHQDDQCDNVFKCKSYFTPKLIISLHDPVPEIVKEEKIKSKGYKLLPGEALLLKLGKQQKKEPIDVDKITKRMRRVLSSF